MDVICRTCLNESPNMKHIFMDDDGAICNMLQSCIGLIIHEMDGFPSKICSNCLIKVNISYEFRQQCEKSYQALINITGTKMKLEFESEIESGSQYVTKQPDTIQLNSVNIYKCKICPNQYTMMCLMEEHLIFDHRDEPNETEKEEQNSLINAVGNPVEMPDKNSNSVANDLIMDYVEEKYQICELDTSGINLNTYSTNGDTKKSSVEDDINFGTEMQNNGDLINDGISMGLERIKTSTECSEEDELITLKTTQIKKKDRSDKSVNSVNTSMNQTKKLRKRKFVSTGTEICQICQRGFATPRNLLIHLRISHRPLTKLAPSCSLCNETFEGKALYYDHMRSRHKGYKHHKCDKCDLKFSTAQHLTRHHLTHFGLKLFPCKLCDKQYTTASIRKKHMVYHLKRKANECDKCGTMCTEEEHFKRHGEVRPRPKQNLQNNFICTTCNKEFNYKENLKAHILRMHKEPRCQCPHCDKRFYDELHLKYHVRSHTDEKQKCEICGGSYYSLSQHKRTHVNKKSRPKLKCDICGNSYRFLSHHKRNKHGKRKRLKCNICGANCRQLIRHRRYTHGIFETEIDKFITWFIATLK